MKHHLSIILIKNIKNMTAICHFILHSLLLSFCFFTITVQAQSLDTILERSPLLGNHASDANCFFNPDSIVNQPNIQDFQIRHAQFIQEIREQHGTNGVIIPKPQITQFSDQFRHKDIVPLRFNITTPNGFPIELFEVKVASGNENIVPNSGLQLSGNGNDRTLTITPSNLPGKTLISLVARGIGCNNDAQAAVTQFMFFNSDGAKEYRYDALGRLVEVEYSDSKLDKYGYDKASNRTIINTSN